MKVLKLLFIIGLISFSVLGISSCDKKKKKIESPQKLLDPNQIALLGVWRSIGTETRIESNDSLAYSKIKNTLDNELSVIRKYIEFNDGGRFKTFISADSDNWHKKGKYIVLNKDLDLEFEKKDNNTIVFDYKYYIDGDTLFITKDDTKGIERDIADPTTSDVTLILQYGVKKREDFKLDEASATRIFIKVDSLKNNSDDINQDYPE